MSGQLSLKIKKSFPTIEIISIKLLIQSYQIAMIDKKYNLDWEEEQFNAYLVSIMNKLNLTKKHHLHIDIEKKLLDEDQLPVGDNNPKKLPRIDMNIESWSFKKDDIVKYFFEAKNLCENNWNKKSGAKVSASYYQKRYIDTGIENFRVGRYYDGTIVGYVLEGSNNKIIDKINIRLSKDTNTIKNIKPKSVAVLWSFSFKDIYSSTHITPLGNDLEIKHIVLNFL